MATKTKNTATVKPATSTKKKAAPVKKSAVAAPVKKAEKQVTQRNAMVLAIEKSFPTNTQRVDRSLSKQLKQKGMKSHKGLQFIMMRRTTAKKGKFAGMEILAPWPCFDKAVTVKNKINQLVEKRTLDLQVRGNRVISVNMFDSFKEELNVLNKELKECAEELKADINAMKAEDLDRLRNARDDQGNPVDLSAFYDDTLYPTEARIDGYGVSMVPSKLQSDYFPEAEEIFEDFEKQKVSRLLDRVNSMFVAINDYIQGNAKKFTENTIENLQEEADLLRDMDFGSDNEAFSKLCDKAIEIATSVNAPAIRQAWQNAFTEDTKVVVKDGEKTITKVDRDETVKKDAKAFLDKTTEQLSEGLEALKKECEGLF